MSRTIVSIDGKEIMPDRGSGILVATGAGAGNGSWYDNVHSIYYGSADELQKDGEEAAVILTENKKKRRIILPKNKILAR